MSRHGGDYHGVPVHDPDPFARDMRTPERTTYGGYHGNSYSYNPKRFVGRYVGKIVYSTGRLWRRGYIEYITRQDVAGRLVAFTEEEIRADYDVDLRGKMVAFSLYLYEKTGIHVAEMIDLYEGRSFHVENKEFIEKVSTLETRDLGEPAFSILLRSNKPKITESSNG